MLNKVKVVICGKDYIMQTAQAPNYVYGLARALEGKINECTDKLGVSQYQAAIMVALSTLDDINALQSELEGIIDKSKEYVDEAGMARIHAQSDKKEIEMLKARIEELENSLKLKKLGNDLK